MKIAFISYEYPPDAAYGGIGTYVYQAARMLKERGHHVEVFTSSPYRSGSETEDGVIVHRVLEKEQQNFSTPIGQIFANRNAAVQFDVLEGPDYAADAREAVRLVPEIPLVIKLHTPSIVLFRLNFYKPESSFLRKSRLYVKSILKGVKHSWGYDPDIEAYRLYTLKADEIERSHALDADEIATPSRALGNIMIKEWGIDETKVSHVPYPYIPTDKLLNIPVDTNTNVVTFLGRLEIRKGVLDLAKAIPIILQRYPRVKFRFVGSSEPSPKPNVPMQQYLEHALQRYNKSVEFTGFVPPESVLDILADTDICVFPSIWENFPCVCLEAMAAARGIVGSQAGGMVDMLDAGRVGKLIPPLSPERIAEAVIELLEDPSLRMALGQAARERLLSEYNINRISTLQEASYTRAIIRRRSMGTRFRKVS
ncbi:MAG TPA: glycosyltransferase family 4 protein [Thermodesulfobacteriota bacterium]|nr:glycosyltransferase family 4 protein [Thermodesulfobacteriota bacterium]